MEYYRVGFKKSLMSCKFFFNLFIILFILNAFYEKMYKLLYMNVILN